MTETPDHIRLGSTDLEKRLTFVKTLLYCAAGNVDSRSETLGIALRLAVKNNCFEIAQLLLQGIARIDEVDRDRRTPLHLCAEFSDLQMAELLLKDYEIRSQTVSIKYDIPINVSLQEHRLAPLLLKHYECSVDIHEIRDDIKFVMKSMPAWLYKPFDWHLRRDNSCNCVSFLQGAHYDLSKKLSSIITYNQTYLKLFLSDRGECYKCMLSEIGHRIDHDLCIWVQNKIKQVSEMKIVENCATPQNLAARSCCNSPIFNDFKRQFVGLDERRSNIVPNPSWYSVNITDDILTTNFEEETILISKIENILIIIFTTLLDGVCLDKDKANSMRPFDYNSNSERNQSKTLKVKEKVESYVNRKDSEGYDALLKAVEFNKSDVVQLLLSNGSDTCSITSQGHGALHLTVNSIYSVLKNSNPVEMVDVLLTSGKFSVDALTFKAETPLHLAISNCGCGLFEKGSEEFQRRRKLQNSIISVLLKNNANVNQQECEGMTPLMIAAERGCDHIVKKLLDWNSVKVDFDARDIYGETALIKAARMHRFKIVELLLANRARTDQYDHRGFTALHAALHDPDKFGSLFELIQNESNFICQSNKEPNEMVNSGVKNTDFVSVKNTSKIERDIKKIQVNALIKILVNIGLQLETMDFEKNTPFDFLVESEIQSSRNRMEAEKCLEEMRNENSVFKETPCHFDKQWLHIKRRHESPLYWLAAVCVMIAEHRVIPPTQAERIANFQDYKERTVFHYAAILTAYERLLDRSSLFKALLTMKCKLDKQDIYQRTPLHYLDVSSRDLLLGGVEQNRMDLTAEQQRLRFRGILKIKDTDDKTVNDFPSMGRLNGTRDRTKVGRFSEAVKAETSAVLFYSDGAMHIRKQKTYNFENQFSWLLWKGSIVEYAYRNSLTHAGPQRRDTQLHAPVS